MRFESEVGTPRHLSEATHNTARSLQTKVLGALENMRQFGATYNHELADACQAAIEEVRNINPRELAVGMWREWMVTDGETGTTLVVRLRRSE